MSRGTQKGDKHIILTRLNKGQRQSPFSPRLKDLTALRRPAPPRPAGYRGPEQLSITNLTTGTSYATYSGLARFGTLLPILYGTKTGTFNVDSTVISGQFLGIRLTNLSTSDTYGWSIIRFLDGHV
jgi:hypothetical protein